MTLPIPISLTCPCCKTKFESLDVMISSTYGSTTDLRQIAGGSDPMYMIIHTCPSCYTGYDDAFKRKRIDPALKERIREEIMPLLKDFNVRPEWPYEFAAPERQYEFAAWIAAWKGGSPLAIGDLYLRAAWCCNDSNDPRKERFYRLKAIEYFEQALERKKVPKSDVGVYTYFVGELHRRVGEMLCVSHFSCRIIVVRS